MLLQILEFQKLTERQSMAEVLAVQVKSLRSAMLRANQKSHVWEFSQVSEYNHQSFNKHLLSTYYLLAQFWAYSSK